MKYAVLVTAADGAMNIIGPYTGSAGLDRAEKDAAKINNEAESVSADVYLQDTPTARNIKEYLS